MAEDRSGLNALGLTEQPFAPTADPAYFYATHEHKSCLHRLWNSIDERHGIAVVLGNYGTGKTTLLRKLLSGMAADSRRYHTAVIGSPIPSWTTFALMEGIIRQFGLRPRARSFVAYTESLYSHLLTNRDRITTLIIDDAQNLNKRGQLELLRIVQNLETPQHKLLNLVLFAQLEWMEVLQAAPNFEQRINITWTLSPLAPEEIRRFIEFRLAQARHPGAGGPAFDDNAIEMIYAYSEGNPRVIVTLCRNSLTFAAQLLKNRIDRDVILYTIEKTTLRETAIPGRTARGEPAEIGVPQTGPAAPGIRELTFPTAEQARPADPREARANELLLRAARSRNASEG